MNLLVYLLAIFAYTVSPCNGGTQIYKDRWVRLDNRSILDWPYHSQPTVSKCSIEECLDSIDSNENIAVVWKGGVCTSYATENGPNYKLYYRKDSNANNVSSYEHFSSAYFVYPNSMEDIGHQVVKTSADMKEIRLTGNNCDILHVFEFAPGYCSYNCFNFRETTDHSILFLPINVPMSMSIDVKKQKASRQREFRTPDERENKIARLG